MSKIQIKPSCLLNVPLHTYTNDFTFIVNGEEFKTSRIISDLISPEICKIHTIDPTMDTFVINTIHQGDFSQILKLLEFKQIFITENQLDFLAEVLEKLDNESFEIEDDNNKSKENEINLENILENIKNHKRFKKFYYEKFKREIEFFSSHFFELLELKKEEINNLQLELLYNILNSDKLRLIDEDQLIEFINKLYSNESKYSILYETVKFENVSSEKMKEFIELFNYNEMSGFLWNRISKRLEQETAKNNSKSDRYEKEKEVKIAPNTQFSGIINHMRMQSSNIIENEINITASSCYNSETHPPKTVILYENEGDYYHSKNEPNSWLCFDFKNHRIIPTDYTIRSNPYKQNDAHLKNWKIEGSLDNKNWETLDEQSNCPYLNGKSIVHTFHIDEQKIKNKEFKFIRIQETGTNWRNDNFLSFSAIEFYGKLI